MKIKNKLINELLELSKIYNSLGEKFKSAAYFNSAITLKYYKENNIILPDTLKELKKIKNIGSSIAEKIIIFEKKNHIPLLQEMKKDKMLQKIIDITSIYGFGIKGAKKLYNSGITNIDEIKSAFLNNKIKLNSSQKLGLKYHTDLKKKIPREELESVEKKLKKLNNTDKNILDILILGSYRRGKKELKDVDILISGTTPKIIDTLINFLKEEYTYIGTFSKGHKKFMGLFIFDSVVRHVDIIYSNIDEYPTKVQYFTGSKEFNIYLRNIAISRGYKLSDIGLYKKNKKIKLNSEKDIFEILDIPYVKPEDRK